MYDLCMAVLDDLDRRLLAALREDGRAPVASLARALGVARATVNSRIDRLVASGIIVGFSVRVRDELEPLAIHAISLIEVEGRTTDDVIPCPCQPACVLRRQRGHPASQRLDEQCF